MSKSATLQSLYTPFISRQVSPEEQEFLHWKEIVSNRFIEAVLKGDKEAIIRLADAADFLKDKDDYIPADRLRDKLLKIKFRSRLAVPRKFTIRQIAERVYDKRLLKHHAADGFSALRRICKQMQIAIRASRKTKQK